MERDKKFAQFIRKHHVLTLATATMRGESGKEDVEPYCANMFYAYMLEENLFVFTSAEETRHVDDAMRNSLVAGSIVLESKVVGNLQGLQFQGFMSRVDSTNESAARRAYLLRFPYAAAMPLSMWVIKPTFMKLTDNRLGFGKKLIWRVDEKQ